jgi:transglutaminase-like putative cysteine protease
LCPEDIVFPQSVAEMETPSPRTFWDDELGYCYMDTNIPEEQLREVGISLFVNSDGRDDVLLDTQDVIDLSRTAYAAPTVGVWVSVPKIWTRGQSITITWTLYNDGYSTAGGYLYFKGGEGASQEVYKSVSYYVRPGAFKTVYMTTPAVGLQYSVGLKTGRAWATQNGVSGYIYDKQWTNAFVQKFETPTSLPPTNDAMSTISGNPNYYWEGLANDNWNIPSENALYHCKDWDIVQAAAQIIDSYAPTTYSAFGVSLMSAIYAKCREMYNQSGASGSVHWSDLYIINHGYAGVCQEYAVLYASFARALGRPARQISAGPFGSPTSAHAWAEIWDGTTWRHADPTMGYYNNPGAYAGYDLTWTYLWAKWDDTRVDDDGSDVDGILAVHDAGYGDGDASDTALVWYDGPNTYGAFTWHESCNNKYDWLPSYNQPATSWPSSIWPTAGGTLSSHPLGFLHTSTNQGWGSGPFWYVEDLKPRPVAKFQEFRISVSYDNPSVLYEGGLGVALFDSNKQIVCYIMLYDCTDGNRDVDFYARWRMSDGTIKQWQHYNLDWVYFSNDIWMYRHDYGQGDEIWVYFGGVGSSGRILSASELQSERNRNIKYVGIQWLKADALDVMYMNANLCDVLVEFTV